MPFFSSKCRHLMTTGVNCQAMALKGKPYCCSHARLHGLKAGPPIRGMKNLRLPVLIDHNAIQVARTMVMDALASGRIDTKCANQILYGIEIASQIVAPTSHRKPGKPTPGWSN
jgi:hypothetical protein